MSNEDLLNALDAEYGNRENPFYYNYVFLKKDKYRTKIKWYEYPILWFLPCYVQINDGYVWHYKLWQGQYYLLKAKEVEK
jgi:hypothetical protein